MEQINNIKSETIFPGTKLGLKFKTARRFFEINKSCSKENEDINWSENGGASNISQMMSEDIFQIPVNREESNHCKTPFKNKSRYRRRLEIDGLTHPDDIIHKKKYKKSLNIERNNRTDTKENKNIALIKSKHAMMYGSFKSTPHNDMIKDVNKNQYLAAMPINGNHFNMQSSKLNFTKPSMYPTHYQSPLGIFNYQSKPNYVNKNEGIENFEHNNMNLIYNENNEKQRPYKKYLNDLLQNETVNSSNMYLSRNIELSPIVKDNIPMNNLNFYLDQNCNELGKYTFDSNENECPKNKHILPPTAFDLRETRFNIYDKDLKWTQHIDERNSRFNSNQSTNSNLDSFCFNDSHENMYIKTNNEFVFNPTSKTTFLNRSFILFESDENKDFIIQSSPELFTTQDKECLNKSKNINKGKHDNNVINQLGKMNSVQTDEIIIQQYEKSEDNDSPIVKLNHKKKSFETETGLMHMSTTEGEIKLNSNQLCEILGAKKNHSEKLLKQDINEKNLNVDDNHVASNGLDLNK